MRTGIEFKTQAKLKGITFWKSHNCSICDVAVGTEIEINWEASYRSACDCGWSPNHSHGWDKVAERYNMQTNEKVISDMDDFWGFDEEVKKENEKITTIKP